MADSPEFELIKRHFTRPAANAVLGVGDDCALVDVTNGMDLAVSTDTMVSGTHFFPDVNPENLGHKALAVNLSDMAAMGATPHWAMLALTCEREPRMAGLVREGFLRLAQEYNVSLIGGQRAGRWVTVHHGRGAGSAVARRRKVGNDVGLAASAMRRSQSRIGTAVVLTEEGYREALMRLYEPSPGRAGTGAGTRDGAIDGDGLAT